MKFEIPLTDYLDAFVFLRDLYSLRKRNEPGFSFASWAKELGVASKSHLSDIVSGKHEFSEEMVMKIAKSLEMNDEEKEHFLLIVAYTNARTDDAKRIWGRKLMQNVRKVQYAKDVEGVTTRLSMSPLTLAIRNLIAFSDIQATTETLVLLTGASFSVVEENLAQLAKCDFIAYDEKSSCWYAKTDFVRFKDDPGNDKLENYHRESLRYAEKALSLEFRERRFRALQLPFSEGEFEQFNEELSQFVATLFSRFHTHQLKDRRLFQISVQAFPVSVPAKNADHVPDERADCAQAG